MFANDYFGFGREMKTGERIAKYKVRINKTRRKTMSVNLSGIERNSSECGALTPFNSVASLGTKRRESKNLDCCYFYVLLTVFQATLTRFC